MNKILLTGAVLLVAMCGLVFAQSHTPTTSARVLYIETTFETGVVPVPATEIAFGTAGDPLDTGTTNNPSGGNPFTLTNTANSNIQVHTYLQATNFALSGVGGDASIAVANLKVSQDDPPTVKFVSLVLAPGNWLDSNAASDGYIQNLAVDTSQNLWFWLDVPATAGGVYAGDLTLKSMRPGRTP